MNPRPEDLEMPSSISLSKITMTLEDKINEAITSTYISLPSLWRG